MSWGVRGHFSESPKIILIVLPNVGTDGRDGALESTGRRLVIDAVVSRRQENGRPCRKRARVERHPRAYTVHLIHLPKLLGRADPVFENLLARVKEV